ncbi:hypothetical protein ACOMHN_048876 [Nucella lapillus]
MASVLNADELMGVKSTLQADNYGNSADIEYNWAIKAGDHADVYLNLISSVDPSCLQLSPFDDELYTKFRKNFPDMKIDVIDEKEMKSGLKKLAWREFIEGFKGRVDEYNFGTLIRLDCTKGYSEENSAVCIRTQFLAIEIARNRENYNRFPHGGAEDKFKDRAS